MSDTMNSRAVVLWFDDAFLEDSTLPDPAQAWQRIFGRQQPRLHRLMRLSLEIGCSMHEATELLDRYSAGPDAAGTYVTAIVDLNLPLRAGDTPMTKWGIGLAHRLRASGIPFVFLTQDTSASTALAEHDLETVACYRKEHQPWRLPNTLATLLLERLGQRVSWISLQDIADSLAPESTVHESFARSPSMAHYPYFGTFQQFVDRWEKRPRVELPQISCVRALRSDSDAHVQQSLLIMLHEWACRRPGKMQFEYARSDDPGGLHRCEARTDQEQGTDVRVIRILSDIPIDRLTAIIETAQRRVASTVLVLPLDESSDRFADVLRHHRIPTVDEIPHVPAGDEAMREELAGHSCALQLQGWCAARPDGRRIGREWLTYPQLLVHPIHWMALIESRRVATDLSDPFEVLEATRRALPGISPDTPESLHDVLDGVQPPLYDHLLTIGSDTLAQPAMQAELVEWTRRALDQWLLQSWQFPYGVGKQFLRIQARHGHGAHGEGVPRSAHGTGVSQEAWEDAAFNVLAGLCAEYARVVPEHVREHRDSNDLRRVVRFVDKLGGRKFTSDGVALDWETLESIRWPHHRYPMPRAISRRLTASGRYLWIQPEGLDMAAVLPSGRLRHRALGDIAAYYFEIFDWIERIEGALPRGWREDIAYLIHAIRRHRIPEIWGRPEDVHVREEFWKRLRRLLRNATPVMFIADQTLRGRPLTGGPRAADAFLASVDGYGKVLSRLRESRGERLPFYHTRPTATTRALLHDLRNYAELMGKLRPDGQPAAEAQSTEIASALRRLLHAMRVVAAAPQGGDSDERVLRAVVEVITDPANDLLGSEGWYRTPAELRRDLGNSPLAEMASLLGTKIDHVWLTLDALMLMDNSTLRFRHLDGYHFLSVMNDWRVHFKDSFAQVGLGEINALLDLFVESLPGLIAHLAWCLRIAGAVERSEALDGGPIVIRPPDGWVPTDRRELGCLLRVVEGGDSYEVFSLGLPGGAVARLAYDDAAGTNVLEGFLPPEVPSDQKRGEAASNRERKTGARNSPGFVDPATHRTE